MSRSILRVVFFSARFIVEFGFLSFACVFVTRACRFAPAGFGVFDGRQAAPQPLPVRWAGAKLLQNNPKI